MKAILFVGHGQLPEAMIHSVQMIAGENEHLYAVSLEPEDGKEEYAEKLGQINHQLEAYESVTVFSDLMGGSPNNGAVEKYLEQDHVDVISGMNLPMVLTAVMGDLPSQMIIDEGRAGIKNVKEEISGISHQEAPTQTANKTEQSEKANSGEPFTIENVRVDARGIHGQVATAWVPKLGVDRIVVIDDLTVKDPMQKTALKMAKPNHIKLSMLSTKKAVERLSDPMSYPGQKLFVIIQRIETLKSLMALDYHFAEVNMGNVPNRPDTTAYRRTVHLTDDEKNTIQSLISKGTHFTAQMVPNDNKVDFDQIIQS